MGANKVAVVDAILVAFNCSDCVCPYLPCDRLHKLELSHQIRRPRAKRIPIIRAGAAGGPDRGACTMQEIGN